MVQSSHRSSVLNRFRQHSRVRISAPFVCALSHYQSRRWLRRPGVDLGVVYDLSTRGARVSTQAEIKPGDEVTLSLRLPKQIKSADIAVATVKWAKDQFFGLAFTELSPAARTRLEKYVAVVPAHWSPRSTFLRRVLLDEACCAGTLRLCLCLCLYRLAIVAGC